MINDLRTLLSETYPDQYVKIITVREEMDFLVHPYDDEIAIYSKNIIITRANGTSVIINPDHIVAMFQVNKELF